MSAYTDEKFTMITLEWCSQASMIQRRGRTGHTNECIAIRMLTGAIYKELGEFDRGGVERAHITRVLLQAAHLAQDISARSSPLNQLGCLGQ